MKILNCFRHGPRQRGAILPLAVAAMLGIVGMTGVAIDVGFIIWKKRQLHAAVDAAALAGAQDLLTKDQDYIREHIVRNYAARTGAVFGGQGGGGEKITGTDRWYNDLLNTPNVEVSRAEVDFKDLKKSQVGLNPGEKSNANALRVTQTAKITPFFMSLFGIPPITISARSAASAGGGAGAPPINLMIVLDGTGSMRTTPTGSTCGTKIQCAMAGARAMLRNLTSAGNTAGLAVFPPVTSVGKAKQTSCPSNDFSPGNPRDNYNCPYSALFGMGNPDRWRDTALNDSFSVLVPPQSSSVYASSRGVLNTNSTLAIALNETNCGIETPICSKGGSFYHTYFAQAIRQAQQELMSISAGNGQKNFMVILSDGDANADRGHISPLIEVKTRFTGSVFGLDKKGKKTSGDTLEVTNHSGRALAIGQTIKGVGLASDVTIIAMNNATKCGDGNDKCNGTGQNGWYEISKSYNLGPVSMTVEDTSWPEEKNQCQQAVKDANAAKAAGTEIYVIGYGVESGGCSKDDTDLDPVSRSVITACETLRWMSGKKDAISTYDASAPNYYATNDTCPSTPNGTNPDLSKVFADIAEGITNVGSRTIPDDAW